MFSLALPFIPSPFSPGSYLHAVFFAAPQSWSEATCACAKPALAAGAVLLRAEEDLR